LIEERVIDEYNRVMELEIGAGGNNEEDQS